MNAKKCIDEGLKVIADVRNDFDTWSDLHSRLAVLALARDKTRVATLMLGSDQSDFIVPVGDNLLPTTKLLQAAQPMNSSSPAPIFNAKIRLFGAAFRGNSRFSRGDSLLRERLVVMVSDMGDGSAMGLTMRLFISRCCSYLKGNRLSGR